MPPSRPCRSPDNCWPMPRWRGPNRRARRMPGSSVSGWSDPHRGDPWRRVLGRRRQASTLRRRVVRGRARRRGVADPRRAAHVEPGSCRPRRQRAADLGGDGTPDGCRGRHGPTDLPLPGRWGGPGPHRRRLRRPLRRGPETTVPTPFASGTVDVPGELTGSRVQASPNAGWKTLREPSSSATLWAPVGYEGLFPAGRRRGMLEVEAATV